MVFFGIDPGTAATGYGVVRSVGNRLVCEDAGVITGRQKDSLPEKLERIYDVLLRKMTEHKPDCVCVEQAFYAKNVHTTLVLGHARGVALLAACKSGGRVVEFSPREIKKAVVGNGNAAKGQVEYMVKTILELPGDDTWPSDTYDALATAICGLNSFV